MSYSKESTMKQLKTGYTWYKNAGMERDAAKVLAAIIQIENKLDD